MKEHQKAESEKTGCKNPEGRGLSEMLMASIFTSLISFKAYIAKAEGS